MRRSTPSLPIAVTMGEPAGIGPDLALLAWENSKALGLPCFYVRADAALLTERSAKLGLSGKIAAVSPKDASAVFGKALPVVQTGPALPDQPGFEREDTAASVIASIEHCVADVDDGLAAAVVTSPINKAALYKAGFDHPGHTEFLGELAKQHWPETTPHPVMMIAGPELMVVPVTIHIPLKDVPATLTSDLIVETALTAAADLKQRFGFANPRLALCGLNPHAGENGTMGTEEDAIIRPAIDRLIALGIAATGPHPADTLFHPEARQTYDCVLGMYHDQVLIPAKTIGFDDSVNITLGLPFVRTSPDHGTAYGLAGTGNIRTDSFAAAIRMAHALAYPEQL
ncbi:4-hydroxythreonine-4-phosphate dehydrogenase PdxA [Roseibium denhamense]|uniref:4-hydroxythreonine-4-phosphate dehydrogenase n=1 Tax=Roseibium denhamense TaxID=76305 RepID=A0ABY1NTN8_9HYPH|nr:4-hydroxythreonine-4-phosphate dehydrogenase PdxA [Roseibium denhamense]MTI05404.1 4-hydroxythreonine-4-phosphate dehydrogenase PdxA [Roseibium denhamense]SMP17909.1 4-hydroxythreonine-4-phosphate dehydrogenase [Roseibium denhamense]